MKCRNPQRNINIFAELNLQVKIIYLALMTLSRGQIPNQIYQSNGSIYYSQYHYTLILVLILYTKDLIYNHYEKIQPLSNYLRFLLRQLSIILYSITQCKIFSDIKSAKGIAKVPLQANDDNSFC
ncbi:hypothetical protein FGO68_gene16527 [Halteria grandinella]|uniref:Uncharacterized protein n=1 Tax=Halteria grandinella TaxID=5974 RepID=A0A8J8NZA2_HALGN|nr:hypothetical protein FGO68_gene16527 [Halteria grandinella]